MRPGPAVSATVTGHPGGRPAHARHRAAVPSFGHLLASVMARSHVPRAGHSAMAAGPAVDQAAFHVAAAVAGPAIAATRVASIPASVDAALGRAMHIEGVPQSWQPALRFIMAQESAGRVDARNPVHSARGLFQLTAANYHLNPNGVLSFGNAVEEAQGGIRYIRQRYGTADNAVEFRQQHRWY